MIWSAFLIGAKVFSATEIGRSRPRPRSRYRNKSLFIHDAEYLIEFCNFTKAYSMYARNSLTAKNDDKFPPFFISMELHLIL